MSISISPTQGPQSGGITVTITSTTTLPLTGIMVFVNNVSVPFTRVDGTHITFTLPAGCGVASIYISTAGGASNKASLFYINPPFKCGITPDTAPAGATVTITGNQLLTTSAVAFGAVASGTVAVVNDSTVTAVVPAGSGTVAVKVTTVGGNSSSGSNFAYAAGIPTVTAISPTSGPASGGTSVTFTGSNYTSATAVTFGTAGPAAFSVTDDGTLVAISPAGTGTVDVTVTNDAGDSTGVVTFDYIAGP